MGPRTSRDIPAVKLTEWRQDVVTRQLDDVNVLAQALVVAPNENDDVRTAIARASLDRFALAMGWSRDGCLPAIAAYAKEHAEFDDELFAPAFILKSIAPEDAKTPEILGAISDDARTLLTRILS